MSGLIPQSFIDELLDRTDIVEVIDRRVPLKKAGKNYKACCPFHNEKTPSFNVNPERQFYHCFGCGAGGNALGFVMDFDNVDFPEAVETLAGSLGMEVPREQSPVERQQQRRKQSIYDVLRFAAQFYQRALRRHPARQQAVDYLKQRGLSGEIARDFAIGFAPPGWDNLLQEARSDSTSSENLEQLEAAGLLVKKENGDYYDRFRERIMFPIRDNRGRVIAFGGRVLGDDKPKYLNSPETSVFHKQRELYGLYEARRQNAQLDMLVLVEGYMDVVSLFQYGINFAVATLGTASSQFHLEKIFRHTARLVVCFDGDEAGQQAALRLLETALPAMQDGREIAFLFLPEGEDPDTFIRNKGKQAFLHALDTAKPLEDLLFENAQRGISLGSDAGKARFINAALEQVARLPEGFFRQSQLKRLAAETGADASLLQEKLDGFKQNQKPRATQLDSAAGKTTPASRDRPGQTGHPHPQSTVAVQANNPERGAEPPAGGAQASVVLAISSLLHFPELAIGLDIPPVGTAPGPPEIEVLQAVHAFIVECEAATGQAPTSYRLFGHWHGTDTGQMLVRCAALYVEPENQQVASQQLADALQNIKKDMENRPLQEFIQDLATKSSTRDLSEQEKELLRKLGRRDT